MMEVAWSPVGFFLWAALIFVLSVGLAILVAEAWELDSLAGGLIVAGVIAPVVIVVLGIGGHVTARSCERQATKMEATDVSFGMNEGCFIQIDGRWIPLESYIHNTGN